MYNNNKISLLLKLYNQPSEVTPGYTVTIMLPYLTYNYELVSILPYIYNVWVPAATNLANLKVYNTKLHVYNS